jgi:DNA-binding response OmpR family regulator
MRVLVVEDEPEAGDLFRDFLRELGHLPLVVRSAEAALGKLQTENVDAIMLDLRLPGMSGLDFLRLRPIRQSGLPIVTVSGTATEEEVSESLRLGALDFVGKPVALDRLQQVMALVEPQVRHRVSLPDPARSERRRGPRVPVTFAVRIREYTGTEVAATATQMSAYGIKVHTAATVGRTAAVRLFFSPDGEAPLEVVALPVRVDGDGFVFSFVDLAPEAFERLRVVVERVAR